MKTHGSKRPLAEQTAASPSSAWTRFWFTPVDPIGLHILRVLTGLLVLSWLLPFAGHLDSLFGLEGWFDQRAYVEAAKLTESTVPIADWSPVFLFAADSTALAALFWASVGVAVLFTLGLWPRLTAVLTWLAVASFTANPALRYGGDTLLAILVLYLMVGYVLIGQGRPDATPVDRWLGGWPGWWRRLVGLRTDPDQPSVAANFALRLIQVHFAIVMVTSGLHKLQFGDWWAGVALWFPLHPPFETTLSEARANADHPRLYLGVLSVAAYAVLAWQIGFPLYAWRRKWRPVLVGGAILGWAGLLYFGDLPLYGPAIVIATLSFLSPEEWRRLLTLAEYVPGVRRLRAWIEGSPTAPVEQQQPSLATVGQE